MRRLGNHMVANRERKAGAAGSSQPRDSEATTLNLVLRIELLVANRLCRFSPVIHLCRDLAELSVPTRRIAALVQRIHTPCHR